MNQRPFSVSLIGWLFVVTGVIGFTYHMTELKLQIPVDIYAAWVLLVRLLAIVGGAFLLRGANWARWLLISWMAYHVANSTLHSIPELVIHSVILVGITYVLFRPQASRYYRGVESPYRA